MDTKTPLRKFVEAETEMASSGVVKLLLEDHKEMRRMMKRIKSKSSTDEVIIETFGELLDLVHNHVEAEEKSLFRLIKDNPKFKSDVLEGYEEHKVHDNVISGINRLRNKERKIQQMKIFCEILEHHLDEEESDLFPKFKKLTSLETRKKIGHNFLEIKQNTQ